MVGCYHRTIYQLSINAETFVITNKGSLNILISNFPAYGRVLPQHLATPINAESLRYC